METNARALIEVLRGIAKHLGRPNATTSGRNLEPTGALPGEHTGVAELVPSRRLWLFADEFGAFGLGGDGHRGHHVPVRKQRQGPSSGEGLESEPMQALLETRGSKKKDPDGSGLTLLDAT